MPVSKTNHLPNLGNETFNFSNMSVALSALDDVSGDDEPHVGDEDESGGFAITEDAPLGASLVDTETEGFVFPKSRDRRVEGLRFEDAKLDACEAYASWLKIKSPAGMSAKAIQAKVKGFEKSIVSRRVALSKKRELDTKLKRYSTKLALNESRKAKVVRAAASMQQQKLAWSETLGGGVAVGPAKPSAPSVKVQTRKVDLEPKKIKYGATPEPMIASMHVALGFSVKGQVAMSDSDFDFIVSDYKGLKVVDRRGIDPFLLTCERVKNLVHHYFVVCERYFDAVRKGADTADHTVAADCMDVLGQLFYQVEPWVRRVQPKRLVKKGTGFMTRWALTGPVFLHDLDDFPSLPMDHRSNAMLAFRRSEEFRKAWAIGAHTIAGRPMYEVVKFQGQTHSKASPQCGLEEEEPNITSHVSVAGVDVPITVSKSSVKSLVAQSLTTMGESVVESGVGNAGGYVKELLAAVSFLTILVQAKDTGTIVGAWYLYLERFGDRILFPKVRTYLAQYGAVSSSAKFQGLLDVDKDVDVGTALASGLAKLKEALSTANTPFGESLTCASFTALMGSELFRHLWDVIGTVSAFNATSMFGFVDEATVVRVRGRIEKLLVKGENVDTFMSRFAALVVRLAQVLKECYDTGSLDPLFGNANPEEFIRYADFLILDELFRIDNGRPNSASLWSSRVTKGDVPRGIVAQVTAEQHAALVKGAIEEGNLVFSRLARLKESAYSATIKTKLEQLTRKAYTIPNTKLGGAARVQPFSIFIFGMPGVGKTNLATSIRKSIGRANEFPTGEDNVMFVQKATNFDDTFYNQWMVCMDDIDQTMGPVSQSVPTHADIVLKLINNRPLNMEKAAVDEKGAYFANFQAALYLSNYATGNIDGYIKEKIAFWRRFNLYVQLVVKPEFANGAGGLDEDAVACNPCGDYWVCKVHRFAPAADDKLPFVFDKELSMREFLSLVSTSSVAWLARQREMLLRMAVDDYCTKCFVAKDYHGFNADGEKSPCSGGAFVREDARFQVQGLPLIGAVGAGVGLGSVLWALKKRSEEAIKRTLTIDWEQAKLKLKLWDASMLHATYAHASLFIAVAATFGGLLVAYIRREPSKVKAVEVPKDPLGVFNSFVEGEARVEQPRAGWAAIKQFKPVVPPTGVSANVDIVELTTRIKRNLAWASMVEPKGALFALQIDQVYWVVPRHFFLGAVERTAAASDVARTSVLSGKYTISFVRGTEHVTGVFVPGVNMLPIQGRDIVVLCVPELLPTTGWLKKHIPETSQTGAYHSFDELHFVKPEEVIKTDKAGYVVSGTGASRSPAVAYESVPTEDGDCGLPVVAKVNKHSFVVGFHTIERVFTSGPDGAVVKRRGEAEEFVLNEIMHTVRALACAAKLQKFSFDPEYDTTQVTVNFDDNPRVVIPYPLKSSVRVALARHAPSVVTVGTLSPALQGATMGTKVVPTMFAEDSKVRDLVVETAGRVDAFQPPRFAGAMEACGWVDPYTVNLSGWTNVPGDPTVWEWCLEDYCRGMEDLGGIGELVPLSDYEAWRGAVEDGINPTNLRTSAGPPLFKKKGTLVEFDDVNQQVFVDNRVLAHVQRIIDAIKAGKYYSTVCTQALKDEAVSAKKNEAHAIRNFNVLPMAYNFLVRKYLAGFIVFMTKHRAFSEILMGINITSQDLSDFMLRLERCDPSLQRIIAGDYEKFDLRQGTSGCLFVARVVDRFLDCTAYDDFQKMMGRQLLLGLFYRMAVIKNDVLMVTYMNPSGGAFTTSCNSVSNSGNLRYVYKRQAEMAGVVEPPPFREVVVLGTGGDDHVGSVATSAWFFDPQGFPPLFLEIGHVYTDSRKTGKPPTFLCVEEATFFKRSFYRTSVGWFAPIEEKTLAKMLSLYLVGDLSKRDHHAVLLSNVRREAMLYSPGRREFYLELTDKLAREYDLYDNVLYEKFTYDDFMSEFRQNKFWTFKVVDLS